MPDPKSQLDNPYFCILPWIHLYIRPDSKVLPCCYGAADPPVGNLLDEDLDEIVNGDGMKTLRSRMLAGKPSRHCQRCYEAEASGFRTLRQNSNENFEHHIEACRHTRDDGHIDDAALHYLDVRFSNVCNLKCRFCWPSCSSAWYDDYKFLNPNYDQKRILRAGRSENHLWSQIETTLDTVEAIYFAGGEPLLMDGHYRILRHLDDAGRHDVALSYTTNLSVLAYKGQSVIDLWNKFRNVRIGISLDGLGRRAEYIRSGLDWAVFQSNLRALRERCRHVKLNANLTISVFNIFELIAIYDRFETDELFRDVGLEINFLDQPEMYAIQVLPAHVKAMLTSELLDYAECVGDGKNKENLGAIVALMNAEDKSHLLDDFFEATDRLDRRRGETIDEVIPEIGQIRAFLENRSGMSTPSSFTEAK